MPPRCGPLRVHLKAVRPFPWFLFGTREPAAGPPDDRSVTVRRQTLGHSVFHRSAIQPYVILTECSQADTTARHGAFSGIAITPFDTPISACRTCIRRPKRNGDHHRER